MGWIFRRSINIGPFRANLSKSGIGGSFGIGPFRWGRSAQGRSYRTIRIPGTGIHHRTSGSRRSTKPGMGCAVLLLLPAVALLVAGTWPLVRLLGS